jgi:hypothetical protein
LPGGRFALPRIIRAPTLLGLVLAATFAAFGSVASAEPKRPIPDYDGRGNQDADADSWVLWIPRVVLSPLYVVNEYVLRRPLGAIVTRAERGHWADAVDAVDDSLSFGVGGKSVFLPIFAFDAGTLPSVGLYYAREHIFATAHTVELYATTWGPQSLHGSLGDRYPLGPRDSVQARVDLDRARDYLFVGIGPDTTKDTRSRYGLARVAGNVGYRRLLSRAARIDAEAGLRRTGFLAGDCCGDPSLDERIAGQTVMAPPGYGDDYTTAYARADLRLDSRRPRPDPGGGVYLHAHASPSIDVHESRSWLAAGGVVGGAFDLTGHRRTVALELALDVVASMSGAIPFTEYPTLGGDRMPGFVAGWMTGRSAAAAQLGYSWPVWLGLDARTRLAVGNAFGGDFDGLAPDKLRLSGDVGLTTSNDPGHGFELLVGLGTETFEQGARVTSVRVALGLRRGL